MNISKVEPMTTTDQIDRTSTEERNALIGYCEPCNIWTKFVRGVDPETCDQGHLFSQKTGRQITSQRSFNPDRVKGRVKQEKIAA